MSEARSSPLEWRATKDIREPHQSFISTPTRFSSDLLGASLDAPPGWRLEHEGATLNAIHGSLPVDQAQLYLALISTDLSDDGPLERHLEAFRLALKQQGLTLKDSFQDSIAGQSAAGFEAGGERGSTANWLVRRGPRWALLVQCVTRDGADPRAACKAALENLSLRAPTDPKARQ
jgi:hypothetical protein